MKHIKLYENEINEGKYISTVLSRSLEKLAEENKSYAILILERTIATLEKEYAQTKIKILKETSDELKNDIKILQKKH